MDILTDGAMAAALIFLSRRKKDGFTVVLAQQSVFSGWDFLLRGRCYRNRATTFLLIQAASFLLGIVYSMMDVPAREAD